MFIWDFVASTALGQILDWIYSQMIGFLGNFLRPWATWARTCST